MNCKKCELENARKELYDNFFTKIMTVMNNFSDTNIDKLTAISGHLRDTLIFHGQINEKFKGDDSLFHTHKDTDR